MPRQLSDGQQAAVRAARARRGELGLTQKELAEKAAVTARTVEMFEAGRTWPRPDTLARLERLGLNWPVGYLTEYAATHGQRSESTLDADIAAILDSNLHPDLKLRLIDQLRALDTPPNIEELRAELAEAQRKLALGEGRKEDRGIA